MTEDEALQTAFSAWDQGWAELHPGSSDPPDTSQPGCVPWCTRNESFTVDELGPLQCWARVIMQHFGSGQATQGARGMRKYERTGELRVQIFGTIDQGAKELAVLAEDARRVLQGLTLPGGFTLFAGRTAELDEPKGSSWAGTSVIFGFRYTATG